MAIEKTFLMVKPDGVERQVIGDIVDRFERRGFVMRGAKLMVPTRELAEKHYAEHAERPFFGELVDFITSRPSIRYGLGRRKRYPIISYHDGCYKTRRISSWYNPR